MVVAVLAVVLAGCSSDAGEAACSEPVTETFDPATVQHVLPGASEPTFQTDPPTSGPHQPGAPRTGRLDETLSRAIQVGSLEAGGVLVHHNGISEADIAALAEIEDDAIAVMPNPDLPEDTPVMVTGWLRRMSCDTVNDESIEAIATFARVHIEGAEHAG